VTGNGPSESVGPVSGAAPSSDNSAQPLRLRADHPRTTRLSRKVLAGGTALALLLISGAVLWALRSNHPHNPAPDELYSTDHHNVADGLTTLPQDYAGIPRDVPRLGPPLPGDLGRPIVTAEGQSGPIGLDAEQQRANQETEAARTSKVFASTTAAVTPQHAASQETPTNTASSSDEAFAQNGQDRKLLFVNAPVDRRTTAPDRLSRPASPFVVQAGTVIPAALITGIRSDLPGQITAQVTENIYDTPTGRARLIPQGARLIGVYDSQIAFGQSRVLLVWTRLIMPNGRSIVLERQQGADAGGHSGLEDEVDNHWGELFKAALLSTILGVGAELGSGADTGTIRPFFRRYGSALRIR
jgi:type IV secretory pathway VirB10-like protein